MIRLGPWLLLSCCTGRPWNFPMIPQERVGGGGVPVSQWLRDALLRPPAHPPVQGPLVDWISLETTWGPWDNIFIAVRKLRSWSTLNKYLARRQSRYRPPEEFARPYLQPGCGGKGKKSRSICGFYCAFGHECTESHLVPATAQIYMCREAGTFSLSCMPMSAWL